MSLTVLIFLITGTVGSGAYHALERLLVDKDLTRGIVPGGVLLLGTVALLIYRVYVDSGQDLPIRTSHHIPRVNKRISRGSRPL